MTGEPGFLFGGQQPSTGLGMGMYPGTHAQMGLP
jgi:hypothetical protein